MTTFAQRLSEARAAAKLPLALLAQACGLPLATLVALEHGESQPDAKQLDRISLVFGMRPMDFLAGAAASGPATLLLKSSAEAGPTCLESLLSLDWGQSIGEFLRCSRDLKKLEQRLDITRAPLSAQLTAVPKDLPQARNEGERLADLVRERLGLGVAPIPSMRELLEALGITVLWTTPDDFAKAVEGSSTVDPLPVVLVNLVGGSEAFWRHRMTMAHEFCHVLFDLSPGNAEAMVSPEVGGHGFAQRSPGWNLFEGFSDLESRADAFAACLLAPSLGVRRAVEGVSPLSDDAIRRVGSEFGVGRVVAVNRLCDVFKLGPGAREQLLSRTLRWTADKFEKDRVALEETGLRRGTLFKRALEAFARDLIDAVEVREYLNLSLYEPLVTPELPLAKQQAVLQVEDQLRRHALRYLAVHGQPHWHPAKVEREGEHWRVEIIDANEPTKVVLTLRLSSVGEVLGVQSDAAS